MKKKLNKLRIEIDNVDKKLLGLLSKRASLAKDVGQTKDDGVIYRPESCLLYTSDAADE